MAERDETSPEWAEKTGYAPGVPLDDAAVPEVRYQVLGGRAYTLEVWRSGSTTRGMATLDELRRRFGVEDLEEGWYGVDGEFLGDDPRLPEPPEEPAFPT